MDKLGYKVKDKVRGFERTTTGRAWLLYGCDQYLLTPEYRPDVDEDKNASRWVDEGRIEFIEEIAELKKLKEDLNNIKINKSHLGCIGRDIISGYEGVISCIVVYVNGRVGYDLTPENENDSHSFSRNRVEVVCPKLKEEEVVGNKPGGFERKCRF